MLGLADRLAEAGVPYDLVEIDIFSPDTVSSDYGARHPFGKIPAFEHNGFRLFETDAIAQYIVGAFGAGHLLPTAPHERARVLQIMRVMDNYAYPALVWGVFVEETSNDRTGKLTPEELGRAEKALSVTDALTVGPNLAGDHVTLADLWSVPMFTLFRLAPTGRSLLAGYPRLAAWLELMDKSPSVVATRFPRETSPA